MQLTDSDGQNPNVLNAGRVGYTRLGYVIFRNGSSIQRGLCRDCAHRFSEKPLQDNPRWSINSSSDLEFNGQLCAVRQEAKKLEPAQQNTVCARDKKLPPHAVGLVAQFLAYLEKEGFCKETEYPNLIRRLAKLGANLLDSETVKEAIARAD